MSFQNNSSRTQRPSAAVLIPRLLRDNPYTGFFGRKLVRYAPFLLPHDKSYWGFTHLVHPGQGLFLDVGGNDGISARGFRRLNKNYRIISIEPNPCHERSLRRLKKHLKDFDYMLLGAGSGRSEMVLYIPVLNGIPIYTEASLRKEFVERTVREKRMLDESDKNVVILEHRVPIVAMDELNLRPDIVKIDAEGFEYNVLLGLVQTIENCRPFIMVEFDPDLMCQVEAFFLEKNYSLLTYDHLRKRFGVLDKADEYRSYSQREIKTNIFCVPTEKCAGLPIGGG